MTLAEARRQVLEGPAALSALSERVLEVSAVVRLTIDGLAQSDEEGNIDEINALFMADRELKNVADETTRC